ncbi:MAG: hypothetical protein J0H57_25380, partial [Rhodospirillales bacterium]|nr:hypothetical protein [Rhodospirillales bacterium]
MYARLRWFIIILLFIGGGISYLDRAALSIAAPMIAHDLALDPARLGIVSLLIIRVIFGMGEGPFSSTASKLVSNWFPRHEQASAVGLAKAGQPLG